MDKLFVHPLHKKAIMPRQIVLPLSLDAVGCPTVTFGESITGVPLSQVGCPALTSLTGTSKVVSS